MRNGVWTVEEVEEVVAANERSTYLLWFFTADSSCCRTNMVLSTSMEGDRVDFTCPRCGENQPHGRVRLMDRETLRQFGWIPDIEAAPSPETLVQ